MADILQTTFADAFSQLNFFYFDSNFVEVYFQCYSQLYVSRDNAGA